MGHLQAYLPLALMVTAALVFALASLWLGHVIGPLRPNPSKDLPYESGIIPTGEASVRAPIRFYRVALLFLLFDVESVYILVWAVIFGGRSLEFASGEVAFSAEAFQRFAFLEMFVFIAILMIGYLYAWRKGGLQWS